MYEYFFVLGKNPSLSASEIIYVLKKLKINFNLLNTSDEIMIISTQDALAQMISRLIQTLGGTVKIGQIIDEVKLDESETKFQQIFTSHNLLNKYFPQKKRKLHLGISLYNAGGNADYLQRLSKQLKNFCLIMKSNLQEAGKKVGFVRIKERQLSSVSVCKNQLLGQGVEIILILTDKSILAGKTLAVQEFGSFSFRDYGRPARDKRVGILPPKLARMMINLAQLDKEAVILDPFCGSGTILQEAILLEYANLIGSDISEKAVTDTKKNIDWLFKNYHDLDKSSYNIKLFQTDVRTLPAQIKQNSVDAVITEPYLGPPLFKKPNAITSEKILSEVSSLYLCAFTRFSNILKTNGKIVIIFPVFEENGIFHFANILDKIQSFGLQQESFFPKDFNSQLVTRLTKRNSLLYGNQEQFGRREILIFSKK